MMNTPGLKFYFTLVAFSFVLALNGTSSHAQTQWQKNHPRRAQVNGRLKNQQKRVDNGLANGSLNTQQAQKIQNQDQRIRNTERRDAAANGGHITAQEQQNLNRRENHVSNEIKNDEAGNAAAGAAPSAPASAPAH